jgi:membrane protease YdiL (CAAX protease family)
MTNLSTTAEAPQAGPRAHGLTGLVRRRPITAILVVIFAVAWPALGIPRLAGHSVPPDRLDLVLSALAFVLFFGTALAVTAVTDGRSGVRRLLAGLVRWRIGVGRWLLVVAAMPVLTLIIAAATGTLRTPPEGWWQMTVTYLLTGLVGGTLLTNLWEEAAWSGFVQDRLMNRHGLLAGSLLTAVPFALIHVPGTFHNTPAAVAMVQVGVLVVLVPFLRYLIGAVFLDTGGSILAVGILHASFNATGTLSAADGGWQFVPALLVLVGVVAVHRRLRPGARSERPTERLALRPEIDATSA